MLTVVDFAFLFFFNMRNYFSRNLHLCIYSLLLFIAETYFNIRHLLFLYLSRFADYLLFVLHTSTVPRRSLSVKIILSEIVAFSHAWTMMLLTNNRMSVKRNFRYTMKNWMQYSLILSFQIWKWSIFTISSYVAMCRVSRLNGNDGEQ